MPAMLLVLPLALPASHHGRDFHPGRGSGRTWVPDVSAAP
jgi:hypothetical protein